MKGKLHEAKQGYCQYEEEDRMEVITLISMS